jgi:hypothetical protein
MNRFQEVDENATDGSGTDKLGQADRRPASIESLRPVTAAYSLGHAASQWPCRLVGPRTPAPRNASSEGSGNEHQRRSGWTVTAIDATAPRSG